MAEPKSKDGYAIIRSIDRMLARKNSAQDVATVLETPHRPLVIGHRMSRTVASLSFAMSGHFSS